jgi:hypothetical protein
LVLPVGIRSTTCSISSVRSIASSTSSGAICRPAPPLTIRAEVPGEGKDKNVAYYEQALVIPPFLDLEKLTASHRHGMLRLTLPLKESVKPRRVQIETQVGDQKQLAGATR